MKIKAVRVLWDDGRGLRWRRAYQAVNSAGRPVGYPQATVKLAASFARGAR